MNVRRYSKALAAGLLVASAVSVAQTGAAHAGARLAPSASPVDRAQALVAQMTLDEKIAMVHGAGYPLPLNAAGYAGVIPGNSRLGIPALYLADSPVGVGNGSTGVTQWPDTSALSASWSTSLARKYGVAYGAEQAGKGHNIALAPTVNILRLPIWGRAPETFSEDPYLTAQSSTAEIRGIQSDHVIATVKHFVANNQEILRSSINVVVDPRALAEIYQPAFRSAVTKADVGAVMCSYNRVGGTYACENGDELTGVLRDAWNFDGLVMSDWGALHSTAPAANAGLDMEMPGAADDNNLRPIDQLFGSFFNSKLKAAVESGAVSRGHAGHDGPPHPDRDVPGRAVRPPAAEPGDGEGQRRQHARTPAAGDLDRPVRHGAAQERRPLLPLDAKSLHSIAVIGDAAQRAPADRGRRVGDRAAVQPIVTAARRRSRPAPRASRSRMRRAPWAPLASCPAVPASAFGSRPDRHVLRPAPTSPARPSRPRRSRTWTSPAPRPR